MNRKMTISINKHIGENIGLYIIVIMLFALGICIGAMALSGTSLDSRVEVKSYIDGFLNIVQSGQIVESEILKESIKINFVLLLAVMLASMMYLGILATPAFIVFKGYCIGYTIAILTDNFGGRGYMIALLSMLPQNLIYIPVIFMIGVIYMKYSLVFLRNKYGNRSVENRRMILPMLAITLIIFVVMLIGSFIEAYLTPHLIRLILKV